MVNRLKGKAIIISIHCINSFLFLISELNIYELSLAFSIISNPISFSMYPASIPIYNCVLNSPHEPFEIRLAQIDIISNSNLLSHYLTLSLSYSLTI